MNHRRLWIVAGIIAFIIVGGFVFSVPHTRDVARVSTSPFVATIPPVTLHDVFKKGLHTITGSLLAPNACSSVTAEAKLVGDASTTGNILHIALTMPITTGLCLELPTNIKFSTTIAGPAQVTITATVNGIAATTTSS
jgi:hypothetical protein